MAIGVKLYRFTCVQCRATVHMISKLLLKLELAHTITRFGATRNTWYDLTHLHRIRMSETPQTRPAHVRDYRH
jgi:hypothetical protein